jgi:FG-GAP-like repeat/Putative Ig domain/RTX calcium-binding nonapeptide repeat (4 copies)
MYLFQPRSLRSAGKSSRLKRQHLLQAAVEALETRMMLSGATPVPTINFRYPIEIPLPAGDTPSGQFVRLEDLSHNGDEDIIFLGGNDLNVLLGNGDGTFKAPTLYPVGGVGGPTQLILADINGDGFLDAVVLENGGAAGQGSVSIFLDNGDGTFRPAEHYYNVGKGASSIAVGELGNVATAGPDVGSLAEDIVVTDEYNRTVTILLGQGNGTFLPNYDTALVGNDPASAAIADINGDGFPDLVVGDTGDASFSVLLFSSLSANGDPQFLTQQEFPDGGDVLSASDFEVLTTNGDAVNHTPHDGTTANFTFSAVKNIPQFIDVTGVGLSGAFTTNKPYGSVYIQQGSGGGPAQNYSTVARYTAYTLVDGQPELVPQTVNSNSGKFIGYDPSTLGLADVNGDGLTDMVVADDGGGADNSPPAITVFLATGFGTFGAPRVSAVKGPMVYDSYLSTPANVPSGMGTDGDGYPTMGSVGTNNYPNTMAIYTQGDGAPIMVVANYGTPPTPSGGMGPPNTSMTPGSISVLLNTGAGGFNVYANGEILDPYGPDAVALADFNGDGKPDLVVANRYNGKIEVFAGNADGAFANTAAYTYTVAGVHPDAIAVADLTGDGKPDIIVTSYGKPYQNAKNMGAAGTISVLLNNSSHGTISFVKAGSSPIMDPYGPSAVTVAKLGNLATAGAAPGQPAEDILVTNRLLTTAKQEGTGMKQAANPGGDALEVLLGNGDGSFKMVGPYPVGVDPSEVTTADFNDDGTLDVAVLNQGSATLSILTGMGSGVFTTQTVYDLGSLSPNNPPQDSAPVSFAVDDIKGDGFPDVVIAYAGSSSSPGDSVGVLFNHNGTLVLSQSNATPGFAPYTITLPRGVTEGGAPVDTVPVSIAAVDVNGDGTKDFVILNSAGLTKYATITTLITGPALSAPTFTNAATATFTTSVFGTFNITTTASLVATLSESGTLPAGLTYIDESNGSAEITGTPAAGTGGQYILALTASNGYFPDAVLNLALDIDQSPAITSATTATFIVGNSASFAVTTTGFPPPTFMAVTGLPSGLSFVDNLNGTATIFGTPATGSSGNYNISLDAGNGIGPDGTQTLVLTVSQAPAITSANSDTFVTGTLDSFPIVTSGFPTAALRETGALPAGLTFADNGNGTATLSGTAVAGSGGIYTFAITANNGTLPNGTQTFTLTVDDAATVTGTHNITATTGTAATFTITTAGFPAPFLSESGALPSGMDFLNNGNGTGSISGVPGAGVGGVYTFTVTATNTAGTGSQVYTLTVDQPPAITSVSSDTFVVGSSGSFTITTTGFPGDAIGETGTLPTGLTFHDNGNGNATLSGIPSAGSAGDYSLLVSANNGIGSAAGQAFTLTVDQTPVFASVDTATFTVGSSGSFTVSASGFPASPPLSVLSGALPAGITFVDNGNGTGTLAGTPAAGTGGVYSITLTANNGVGSVTDQSFTITVDQAPAITSLNLAQFIVGTANSVMVTSTGFPAATISESGQLPGGLNFQNNGNGTAILQGTPSAGSGGFYSITLTASNNIGSVATQTFSLTVEQPPSITTGTTATFFTSQTGSFTFTATGLPTPALTLTGALPAGVTFLDNGNGTATLAGSPAAGTAGVYGLTLAAGNGFLPGSSQDFTLTVVSPPSITITNNIVIANGTSGNDTINVSVNGGDLVVQIDNTTQDYPLNSVSAIDVGGQQGDDSITVGSGVPAIYVDGGAGNDSITANNDAQDTLQGGDGNDLVQAGSGNELLAGGTGSDTLVAGSGNDTLGGGPSSPVSGAVSQQPVITITNGIVDGVGTPNADTASLTISNSQLVVQIDNTTSMFALAPVTGINISMGAGNDSVSIGAGVPAAAIGGGAGNDTIVANNNAPDTLRGGQNADSIVGGLGAELLVGGKGADTLVAGASNETLVGGIGKDSLIGAGHDLLQGGPGNDTIRYESNDTPLGGLGNDSIILAGD